MSNSTRRRGHRRLKYRRAMILALQPAVADSTSMSGGGALTAMRLYRNLAAMAAGVALISATFIFPSSGQAQVGGRALSPVSTEAAASGAPNQKGWWISLGSFSPGNAAAFQIVNSAAARCGLHTFNDVSDNFVGFQPGYNVFVVGPYMARVDAEQMLQVAKTCFPDAYLKYGEYTGGPPIQAPAPVTGTKGPVLQPILGSSGQPRLGPSFPCPSPRDPLAMLICSSPELSQADLRMAQAYYALRAQLDPNGQNALRQEAAAFNRTVRSQCGIGTPDSGKVASPAAIPCVLQRYLTQRNLMASRLVGSASEEAERPLMTHLALQADLKALGFLPPDAEIDGVYGPATRTAILQWQQSRGRPPTPHLGNLDAAALDEQVAALHSQPFPATDAAAGMAASHSVNPINGWARSADLANSASQPLVTAPVTIPLKEVQGTFVLPVTINGMLTLNFIVDSGASDVSVPADVVSTLARTGTIDDSDFIGKINYVLADGSQVPSAQFRIRSLKVGNLEIKDVTAGINDVIGDPLLGQSFLRRFRSWSIDNQRHVLILNQ